MSTSLFRKPFKVEFLDGPLNGAIRYYSSLSIARSVARRYVRRPLAGRMFSFATCEIYYLSPSNRVVFLEVIH